MRIHRPIAARVTAAALLTLASVGFAALAEAARFGVLTLSNQNDSVSEFRPRLKDGFVVWQSGSGAFSEVWLWDGEVTQNLSSNGVADENPELDGIHVVWQQGAGGSRDIAVHDLLTGQTLVLVSPGDEIFPVVSGITLAWVEMVDTDGEVFVRPGPIGDQLTGNSLVESSLLLDGPNLIFVQGDDLNLTPGDPNDDLHGIGFWKGATREFFILGMPGNDDINPSIAGDTIVWQGGEDGSGGIWISDTSPAQNVLFPGSDDRNPHTDGRSVVWDHFDGVDRDIYKVDLASPNVVAFVTTDNLYDDVTPRIQGDDIVWTRQATPGDSEIWVSLDGAPAQAISQTVGNGRDDVRPQVDSGLVVWERCTNLGELNELCDVMLAPEAGATLLAAAALAVLAALAQHSARRALGAARRPR
jgi:hypothetical protein